MSEREVELAKKRKEIVSEGKWVLIGQVLSAIGTLVGLRLLTSLLEPSFFGQLMIYVGLVLLLVSLLVNPVNQFYIFKYPVANREGEIFDLQYIITRILHRVRLSLLIVSLSIGWIVVRVYEVSILVPILTYLLFFVESEKSLLLGRLNAARRQKEYAQLCIMESWLKAILPGLLLLAFPGSVFVVLLGLVVAVQTSIFIHKIRYVSLIREGGGGQNSSAEVINSLNAQFRRYSLPLVPIGLAGWVAGQGDRYVIATVLDMQDVGFYAAIYAIVSRPFLIFGSSLESLIRPHFQEAIAMGSKRSIYIIRQWTFASVLGSLIACTIVYFLNNDIARIFLGAQFRAHSELMIWIALGYTFLILSYIFERVLYAIGQTATITTIQISIAGLSVLASYIGATASGLWGATIVVPIYFLAQLLITLSVVRHRLSGCL